MMVDGGTNQEGGHALQTTAFLVSCEHCAPARRRLNH
jgi:hypothetical protein